MNGLFALVVRWLMNLILIVEPPSRVGGQSGRSEGFLVQL